MGRLKIKKHIRCDVCGKIQKIKKSKILMVIDTYDQESEPSAYDVCSEQCADIIRKRYNGLNLE